MDFVLEKQDYGHFATPGGWMDGWMRSLDLGLLTLLHAAQRTSKKNYTVGATLISSPVTHTY